MTESTGIILICAGSFVVFVITLMYFLMPRDHIKEIIEHREIQESKREIRKTGYVRESEIMHDYRIGKITREEMDYAKSMLKRSRR